MKPRFKTVVGMPMKAGLGVAISGVGETRRDLL
jgi:hypothetical protein